MRLREVSVFVVCWKGEVEEEVSAAGSLVGVVVDDDVVDDAVVDDDDVDDDEVVIGLVVVPVDGFRV